MPFHLKFLIFQLLFFISLASLCQPIIENAGKDITYWFDKETKEPRKHIDLSNGEEVYYCPRGRFLHIPDSDPNLVAIP